MGAIRLDELDSGRRGGWTGKLKEETEREREGNFERL